VHWFDEAGEVRSEKRVPHPTPPPRVEPQQRLKAESKPQHIMAYGISRSRLEEVVQRMRLPAVVVADLGQADLVMTSKNHYRRRPQVLLAAEAAGIPIYVIRANTLSQMEQGLAHIYGEEERQEVIHALKETEEAIEEVKSSQQPIELSPQSSFVRRLQHQLAQKYNLFSRSSGRGRERRVTISTREEMR